MASRGALYIVWGHTVTPILDRAINSLRLWHPELPIHVERLEAGMDPIRALLLKSRMASLSPFEETVFLDADTVVLDRLDYGFERAQRYGIACAINECPWARRYGDPALSGDQVEYNTGVLFFTRSAQRLFDAWADTVENLDSSIEWMEDGVLKRMPFNDQAGFAKAMEETGTLPFVLPLNWNFRPPFHRGYFGPLKIWHDYGDVPDWVRRENEKYANPGARHLRFYPLKIG
jgi:hypothetical protein